MVKITTIRETTYGNLQNKEIWLDFSKTVRTQTTRKVVGDEIASYCELNEFTEFEIVNSKTGNSKNFSVIDWNNETDGLSRVEIFKEIQEMEITENFMATGKFLVIEKKDENGKTSQSSKVEIALVDRKVKIIY